MADNCNLAEKRVKLPPEAAETGATPEGSARKALSDCAFDAMKQGEGGVRSSDDTIGSSTGAILPPVEIAPPATSGDIVRGTLNIAKDIAVGAVNEVIENPLGVAKSVAYGAIGGAAAVLVGPELALAAAAGYGVGMLGRKLYDDGSEKTMDEISSSMNNLARDLSVEFAPQKYGQAEREKAQAHLEGFGAQGLHLAAAVGGGVGGGMAASSVKAGWSGSVGKKSVENASTAAPDASPGTPVPPGDVPPPTPPPPSPVPHAGEAPSYADPVPPTQAGKIGDTFPVKGPGGTPGTAQLTPSPGDPAPIAMPKRSALTDPAGTVVVTRAGAEVTMESSPYQP